MKEAFAKFYELMKSDRALSCWSSSLSLKERTEHLAGEVQEVIEAIKKNDYSNLKEELGDVLLDWLGAIAIAEEKGICNIKEVIQDAHSKINRRKPHLRKGKKVTLEEEYTFWNEAKQKEKLR